METHPRTLSVDFNFTLLFRDSLQVPTVRRVVREYTNREKTFVLFFEDTTLETIFILNCLSLDTTLDDIYQMAKFHLHLKISELPQCTKGHFTFSHLNFIFIDF